MFRFESSPVVFASLKPPAIGCDPSGMNQEGIGGEIGPRWRHEQGRLQLLGSNREQH
jgi:hypothetical protein